MEKVYFIKHKGINPVKIGRTNDLAKRLASFNNASPYGIEVIGVIDTNDSINLEQKIHHIFRNNRLNGEWFSITVEACQDIINIYKDADYINAKNLFELSYNKKEVITNDVDSEDIKKLYEVVSLKHNDELGFRTKVVLNQKEIKERFGIKRNESIKFFMDSMGLKYKTNGLKGFSKKGYMFYIK